MTRERSQARTVDDGFPGVDFEVFLPAARERQRRQEAEERQKRRSRAIRRARRNAKYAVAF